MREKQRKKFQVENEQKRRERRENEGLNYNRPYNPMCIGVQMHQYRATMFYIPPGSGDNPKQGKKKSIFNISSMHMFPYFGPFHLDQDLMGREDICKHFARTLDKDFLNTSSNCINELILRLTTTSTSRHLIRQQP